MNFPSENKKLFWCGTEKVFITNTNVCGKKGRKEPESFSYIFSVFAPE
jgi:hypothetical protein